MKTAFVHVAKVLGGEGYMVNPKCERHGIVRSMSRKGCSPDNSVMEGFFGRMKV